MIFDTHNRQHNYLRISLTDRCNLRCAYCMPDDEYHFMPTQHLMQPAEIEEIARVFVSMGVDKIRLTGGEPLARRDFGEILQRLSSLPVELTLTTNATLLHRHLDALQQAKVQNLNISLDTMSAEKFIVLTRRDMFSQTMNNINLAIERGLNVKINMVVMKSVNDDEILDFVGWTKNEAIDIRFIEFMPFKDNRWKGAQVVTKKQVLELIETQYSFNLLPPKPHSTSEVYTIPGHKGTFAIISTMTAPFCGDCNRMRLTADGKMKNCLFSKDETDLLSALRTGIALEPLIRQNVLRKAAKLGGQFGELPFEELEGETIINRSMISIGG
jgi:cyclic pyranopterin phosphate synthase